MALLIFFMIFLSWYLQIIWQSSNTTVIHLVLDYCFKFIICTSMFGSFLKGNQIHSFTCLFLGIWCCWGASGHTSTNFCQWNGDEGSSWQTDDSQLCVTVPWSLQEWDSRYLCKVHFAPFKLGLLQHSGKLLDYLPEFCMRNNWQGITRVTVLPRKQRQGYVSFLCRQHVQVF